MDVDANPRIIAIYQIVSHFKLNLRFHGQDGELLRHLKAFVVADAGYIYLCNARENIVFVVNFKISVGEVGSAVAYVDFGLDFFACLYVKIAVIKLYGSRSADVARKDSVVD